MADQKDMDYTYTMIDKIFRLSIGETADYSGAMYNGDYSMTLEEAQRNKHEYVLNHLNITKASRVLDMGCGWGPFLSFVKEIGVAGIGVTLSAGQANACRRNGLDVYLKDCLTLTPETFGIFDAIVSLGAFEHHCSSAEWEAGRQDDIYSEYFKVVSDLLHSRKRFYLQTMTFGKNMIDADEIDINAEKGSDAHICALVERVFPGSWPPSGKDQILQCAAPFFEVISINSGRLDYIETMKQWGRRWRKFGFRKYLYYSSLIPKYLTNRRFRERLDLPDIDPHRLCFEREIMDHYRIVFEKRA